MKTLIDAVNEFEGEWPCNDSIIMYFTKGFYSKFYRDNIESAVTDEEFNDLVSQMKTNFGECIPYAEYKTEYARKEKVIIMLDELHKLIDEPVKELDVFINCTSNNDPQPALTYTQEMADNGELPSVGMECLAMIDLSWQRVEVLHKKINGQGLGVAACRIISDINGQCGILKWCMDFKPLTPPIELIDGRAYQFDFEGDIHSFDSAIGIYDKTGAGAMWVNNKVFLVSQCTNIQPLTVEVK